MSTTTPNPVNHLAHAGHLATRPSSSVRGFSGGHGDVGSARARRGAELLVGHAFRFRPYFRFGRREPTQEESARAAIRGNNRVAIAHQPAMTTEASRRGPRTVPALAARAGCRREPRPRADRREDLRASSRSTAVSVALAPPSWPAASLFASMTTLGSSPHTCRGRPVSPRPDVDTDLRAIRCRHRPPARRSRCSEYRPAMITGSATARAARAAVARSRRSRHRRGAS